MLPEDYLLAFSEVALGFLGFSSVVLVLGWRSETWTDLDRTRMVGLFTSSAGALLLTLAALVMASAGVPKPALWHLSSGLMVVYSGVALGIAARQLRTMAEEDVRRFAVPGGRIIVAASLANVLLQASNALSILPLPPFSVFYFGLVWFLVFASYTLARALFAR